MRFLIISYRIQKRFATTCESGFKEILAAFDHCMSRKNAVGSMQILPEGELPSAANRRVIDEHEIAQTLRGLTQ